ncbi:MAG: hypothetical protein O2799_08195 [Planctomycetota bacterium]|nr:hypothetical protein [Planctomycetota bacterium]
MRSLGPALAALVALAYAALFWGAGPVDDDYICYRFAASLAEGRGFAWMGTEQAEGFTVPLWVALHALGQLAGLEPSVLSRVVGTLASAAAAWVVGQTWAAAARGRDRRRTGGLLAAGPAWILALTPALAFHANAGLGTSLQALLLALHARALLACGSGRPHWRTGWPLAVACLLRQEAALFVLPLLVRRWRAAAILPLAALAGWTGFRLLWFGRWLPLTWSAKKLPLAEDLAYGLRYLVDDLPILGSLVLALLALPGLRAAAPGALRPLAAGYLLHLIYVLAVGGDHMAWSRYLIPAYPVGLLLAAWFLAGRAHGLALSVAAGLAMAAALQAVWLPLGPPLRSAEARFLDQEHFEQRWVRIGRWMRTEAPQGTRLATSPIGALGWESGLEVLDLLGLVHEHALRVQPDLEGVSVKGHHRSATAWVLAERPEWVLLGNGVRIEGRLEVNPWERGLVQDPRFAQGYRRAEVPLPSDAPFDLFIRRDHPLPPGASWLSP